MNRGLCRNLLYNCRGAAAAEMALLVPLMLVLLFGSVEIGNYFYNEHKLVKGVRDGARYAARQGFIHYAGCSGTESEVPVDGVAGTVFENTKLLVRKGKIDTAAADLLANWDDANVNFTVTMTCSTTAGGTTMGGIYKGMTGGAPVVIVRASLPYRSVLSNVGFDATDLTLNAVQQAAVVGV